MIKVFLSFFFALKIDCAKQEKSCKLASEVPTQLSDKIPLIRECILFFAKLDEQIQYTFCGYCFFTSLYRKDILTGTTENCSISRKPNFVTVSLLHRRQCLQTDVRSFLAVRTSKLNNVTKSGMWHQQSHSTARHTVYLLTKQRLCIRQ